MCQGIEILGMLIIEFISLLSKTERGLHPLPVEQVDVVLFKILAVKHECVVYSLRSHFCASVIVEIVINNIPGITFIQKNKIYIVLCGKGHGKQVTTGIINMSVLWSHTHTLSVSR